MCQYLGSGGSIISPEGRVVFQGTTVKRQSVEVEEPGSVGDGKQCRLIRIRKILKYIYYSKLHHSTYHRGF